MVLGVSRRLFNWLLLPSCVIVEISRIFDGRKIRIREEFSVRERDMANIANYFERDTLETLYLFCDHDRNH